MQDGISSGAWLELRLPAATMEEDAFMRLCERLGAAGTALETRAATDESFRVAWFPVGADEPAMRARISAAMEAFPGSANAARLKRLDDDWATAWQRDWKAMPAGRRLWVRPSFCEPAPEGRLDIVLDPGMAFGTGQHATTRLCLTAIERLCEQAEDAPASVLDMGAGSGILAIAAAKLGVCRVLAIDNDPDAVAACRANATANGVEVDCRLGDAPPDKTFDLVVANILAGPLREMAPALSACAGKWLILSGILEEQAGLVCEAYVREGMNMTGMEVSDGWVAITFASQE